MTHQGRRVGVLIALCATFVVGLASSAPAFGAYGFVKAWGSTGDGDGEFSPSVYGIDTGPGDEVYVADGNHRIQVFDSDGNFLRKWGTEGSDPGEFQVPVDVAVDSAGNVYVSDYANHRVQRFTSTGTFVDEWGVQGSADGEFRFPDGLGTDTAGNVYVADTDNDRIQAFTSTGTFMRAWGTAGSGAGELEGPGDVAVDAAGDVYVSDAGNHRIQKFSATGSFLTQWGSQGNGNTQFEFPDGLAIDSQGDVHVADVMNSAIKEFGSAGAFKSRYPTNGSLQFPEGVAFDSHDDAYVTELLRNRVVKFSDSTSGGGGGEPPPGGGDPPAGDPRRPTATSAFCNRGPNPGDPWTCTAVVDVADSQGGGAPSGEMRFSTDGNGTFPLGTTCAPLSTPTTPNRASCSATFLQDDGRQAEITAEYAGDSAFGPSAGNFTIKGRGDFLVCGPAPLPTCPPGPAPPQVCVTIWTSACPGLAPPDLPEVCISAWQSCEGFGGRSPGGPIDLSGFPTGTVTTKAGCEESEDRSARQIGGYVSLPGSNGCRVMLLDLGISAEDLGRAIDAQVPFDLKSLESMFRRTLVDVFCEGSSTSRALPRQIGLGGLQITPVGQQMSTLYEQLGLPGDLASALRAQIDELTAELGDRLIEAYTELLGPCDRFQSLLAAGSNPFATLPICDTVPSLASLPLEHRLSCRDLVTVWQSVAATYTSFFEQLAQRLRLSGAPRHDARSARAFRKGVIIPIATATGSIEAGEKGKLQLRATDTGGSILRKLRKEGVHKIRGTATTTTIPMLGMPTEESRKKVTLRLAKKKRR